jgi:hypothetical protein
VFQHCHPWTVLREALFHSSQHLIDCTTRERELCSHNLMLWAVEAENID